VRFTKLVLSLRVTTYDLRQVTSPMMEVKRYYIVSYIFYVINPTAQKLIRGPGVSMSYVVGSNNSYKLIPNTEWVRARLCKLQKGCTRFAADIAEILLKVALKHKQIKSKAYYINNHILNVLKYIFNIQLIINLQ
jgi:hypothetical protein